jgi:hypothetical protein
MSMQRKSSFIWIVSLPLVSLGLCFGWLRRVFRVPRSARNVRADDKTRQSEVRRGLRGLSPDHDQREARP